ncbi:DUF3987 domain-containing protein [Methylobacterium sp. W2]|uniref:YfjI family protein n=1 Tax=Methylobacterium sp. W2 TaxID=2598107 RepID=UPI0029CABB60|nr:YfjI family protein [Methylobacterium sp. W2]MCC0808059.1 DUF3987 domain-containing protein [Methylobacterium sp. W2]
MGMNHSSAEDTSRVHRRSFTPPPEGKAGRGPYPQAVDRDHLEIAPALSAETVFPVHALPPLMKSAVEALEEHIQAPRSMCAHSVLSAAMLSCQGLADVEVQGLPTPRPLSLFMLVVAVSGERKSACDDLALLAVSKHEAQLRAEWDEEAREYKATDAAYQAEKKKIERDGKITHEERLSHLRDLAEPVAPLIPVIRAKEANLEGLLNVLQHGRASIGIFTSEGGQFLGGHGMGDDAKTRTITGLSELWDSGSAQRVRSREHCFLNGRRVGISLAAQPKVASSLLSDELAKDQGFVGRFLVAMPDSTIGKRQIRGSDPLGDHRLMGFHRRCGQILRSPLPLRDGARNELQPPTIGLDDEAWHVWQAMAQAIEDGCKPGGPWIPVRSAALKMAENVARIAGILAVFEDPTIIRSRGDISGDVMAAAAAIGMFYLQEALRLTGHAILDPEIRAQNELAEWLTTDKDFGPGKLISPSIIQKRAPNHLRTNAATVRTRIEALVSFGRLEPAGRNEIGGQAYRETYRITAEGG